MKLVLGLFVGLVWGALFAALSCFISIRAIRKNGEKAMMNSNLARIAIDLAALAIPVLLRSYLPFRVEMVLVGTAAALGLALVWFAFQVASGKIK